MRACARGCGRAGPSSTSSYGVRSRAGSSTSGRSSVWTTPTAEPRRSRVSRCRRAGGGGGFVDEAVWLAARGRLAFVCARAGHDHRFPRPKRRREDDDVADAARTCQAERGSARPRPLYGELEEPALAGRCGAGSNGLPSGPLRPRPSADAGPGCALPDARVDEVLRLVELDGRRDGASRGTRWGCGNGLGWRPRCSAIPSC